MTGKQRSFLRSMANNLDSVLQIGKDGIDEKVIKQADEVLEARELIKVGVLKNSMIDVREACGILCRATGAQPVQVIGNKFVIYRPSSTKHRITLPD